VRLDELGRRRASASAAPPRHFTALVAPAKGQPTPGLLSSREIASGFF